MTEDEQAQADVDAVAELAGGLTPQAERDLLAIARALYTESGQQFVRRVTGLAGQLPRR